MSIQERVMFPVSMIGILCFGVGVIASLFQSGFISACFGIALLAGVSVIVLDKFALLQQRK